MRKLIIIIFVITFFSGCSYKDIGINSKDDSSKLTCFDAIVISIDKNTLSVINLNNDQGFRKYDPVIVSYDTSKFNVSMGDVIEINFNGMIAESYPCQIGAESIRIKDKANESYWPATSAIPDDYKVEEAVKDGCFVRSLKEEKPKELLLSYIDNTKNGLIGFLRMVAYTVEGDPIISDVMYDGKIYYVFEDVTRDKFAGTGAKLYQYEFQYVNYYENDTSKIIYLADKEGITEKEYEKDMINTYMLSIEYKQ